MWSSAAPCPRVRAYVPPTTFNFLNASLLTAFKPACAARCDSTGHVSDNKGTPPICASYCSALPWMRLLFNIVCLRRVWHPLEHFYKGVAEMVKARFCATMTPVKISTFFSSLNIRSVLPVRPINKGHAGDIQESRPPCLQPCTQKMVDTNTW